ncbi:hypothetical protein [Cytobacillus sp. FSL R5-0596]|uniref:hypothetical protein n=1 Tax=Cytobacillus sp. FSL R5-0596 TaxID=2954696 RepID=UPI0030F9A0A1
MRHNTHPTVPYNEQLLSIDEQICALLKQRKVLSNNNPGLPSSKVISSWADKYELYEDYLNHLFETMRFEGLFKSRIEPTGYRKHLSVLKSIEHGERIYSVTVIRQYQNASVIQLHVDWDGTEDLQVDSQLKHHNNTFELYIGNQYECRQDRAGGSTGHFTYNFIVSPPLPDNISEIDLIFKEYTDTLKEQPTGLEIVMHLD